MTQPLCIDLFCGLGGWSEGFLAEGYRVVGFDIERHRYPAFRSLSDQDGTKLPGNNTSPRWSERPVSRLKDAKGEIVGDSWHEYPAQLVLQDVLTIHGSQFRNAACIVASPPCQEYSYMAMPWSRAKQIAKALRGQGEFPEGYTGSRTVEQLNALFNACFRIQREASEAAGRHIPMVVENVKGAQAWVGRAKANFGSFYLWGDVAMVGNRVVCRPEFGKFTKPMKAQKFNPDGTQHGQGSWFAIADSKNRGARKVEGFNFHDYEKTGKPGRSFQSAAVDLMENGRKGKGSWFGDYQEAKAAGKGAVNRYTSSKSPARKAASAQIAKIPFDLARYIAATYKPWYNPAQNATLTAHPPQPMESVDLPSS